MRMQVGRIGALATASWFALLAPAGAAAVVNDCDWPSQARNIVEPWEANTRSFSEGAIRIAYLDTGGEPVCCSSHLLILAPDPDSETGERQCRLLSDGPTGTGFQNIGFGAIGADYDPAKGLTLTVPVERYIDGTSADPGTIEVLINQATGSVTVTADR